MFAIHVDPRVQRRRKAGRGWDSSGFPQAVPRETWTKNIDEGSVLVTSLRSMGNWVSD